MESPDHDHEPESPVTEDEDSCFPCKGCGNILEEGKAFELSGNRWHIDCFRCNKCDTLLDSDANLLLLGDGSLICNNCTYSCAACHNKIEDLAILTGDQAFCAGCFRCRNCKRKIENLKYARTSQGIFCMSCHETIMARRRKRNKTAKTPTLGSNAASPMLSLDKSLPSLPVEDDSPSDGHVTPTELSPRPRPPNTRTISSRSGHTPDQLSPLGFVPPENHLRTTPRSYKRYSQNSQVSEHSTDNSTNNGTYDPYSFIPVVLDPSPPAPDPLPSTTYRPNRSSSYNIYQNLHERDQGRNQLTNTRPSFERNISEPSIHLDTDKVRRPYIPSQGSRQYPGSGDGQDMGRKSHDSGRERLEKEYLSSEAYNPSAYYSKENESIKAPSQKSMISQNQNSPEKRENFKLGEVPNERKKSVGTIRSVDDDHSHEISISFSPLDLDMPPPAVHPEIPPRGDSYKPPVTSPASVHKKSFESPIHSNSSSGRSQRSHGTSGSNASAITAAESPEVAISNAQGASESRPPCIKINTGATIPSVNYQDTPSSSSSQQLPPFLSKPLSHPRPSTAHSTTRSDNLHLMTNYDLSSTILPHPFKSPVSDLSMDEDIARVFGAGDQASILRRVSNAVRHGRSFSDLAARTSSSPKWPRSPSAGHPGYIPYNTDISPVLSLDAKEENIVLKQELRRAMLRVAELEAKLTQAGTAKALDSNITEKRNTVALLETEREAFLRELMVIKERVDAAKDGQPLNMEELKSDLIRGVTRELEDLKATLKTEIQRLVTQRDQLVEEVNMFAHTREQTIQDTEQLNLKNAQLADLNNELTRRIQGQFKANKAPVNGLGIFTGNPMDILESMKGSSEEKRPPTANTSSASMSMSSISIPIPVQDYQQQPLQHQPTQQLQSSQSQLHANDGAEVLVAQKVTTLKNGAQPKKTFWKKGSASIMKGAGKGFNKVTSVAAPDAPGAKIFGARKGWAKNNKSGTNALGGSGSSNALGDNGVLGLFGTELEQRAEYEGNRIPNVVQKCIQEVEIRGMDFEGIYRKSGGASQMRQIQDAFERGEDPQFDSNVDICGVTSVLKQYFRNLPNPLLTYEIYERFVETTNEPEDEKRVEIIKDLIDELPSIHRDCLQFVVFHLARVAARKEENLMTTRNLAVVFAPTLLRHMTDEREITDMHAKNNAIQFLIDHNEVIF
ncbi:uncharacterized protein H6S33_008982 [Morchella sextelata]|uniref:uncharacterized protein n=1 Tax=Morchella sextelata TaxID=1174677 RepID=UPI001D036DFF|nr:uncharacterized protein H6S33_008982 [Morchella sextelata]KAH0612602.1 hypothetical protein H6S33_008982 [Morchella sextelata]